MRNWNWRRIATITVVTALAAAGLVFWSVIDPAHAYAATALAAALSILWSATDATTDDPEWPQLFVVARAGGRHDVSDLGWSVFGRDGHVTDRVVRRIRALAADRLRAHGVDPSDPDSEPDAERLLGARVVRQLKSRQPPTARTVQTWLDAIERLGAAPTTEENRA
ncbi:hypothetical protein [Promicromonospora iranensis]|uniref:Uncharacterized protein n=1 Tax=Promicromonospora iranensis TaxID=1105144 RepID=A0ABU2CGY4_9MICO|nr:hypothetical protein [Promicromonospora iranensis]MDR7380571.1 hypothetical protein [Promicromonospora iranensis]